MRPSEVRPVCLWGPFTQEFPWGGPAPTQLWGPRRGTAGLVINSVHNGDELAAA